MAGTPNALSRAYQRGVLRQVILGSAVLSIVFLGRLPAKGFGLTSPRSWTQTWETLGIFLIAILASSVWVRYRGDRQFNRLRKTIGAILPISKSERWWFAAVGIGAGLSEELLYRGFLLYYLWVWLPGLDWTQRIIVSSLIFGLAHLYQGWKGVLGTTAYGFCFAWLYAGSGSLLIPMTIHAAVDLRILAILTPKRLQLLEQENRAAFAVPPSKVDEQQTIESLAGNAMG
jgi:membrane protease YdiL (CAAX protease family)